MPRRGGKVKIQWIMQKAVRQATFRKRHATLFDKARDLSVLCGVPAAVVVYGHGEAEPKVWPGVEEVREILQRHRDLPESLKEAHRLDNEGFMRRRTGKMRGKVESCRAAARRVEVNLVLNEVGLGRRRGLDDLPRDLAAAAVSALDALRNVTADRLNLLRSGGGAAQAAAAAAAALMALQEPPMVPPLAVAGPMVANAPLVQPAQPPPLPPQEEEPPMVTPLAMAPMVAGAPILLPAPEPEPAPPQSELMVAPAPVEPPPPVAADLPLLLPAPEPEPAPPLQPELVVATVPEPEEPTMVADAPLLLPAAEPEPQNIAAAVASVEEALNLEAEPRNGSFLLEMADAIMDDGSGRQATAEDVDRLLIEHGLERFKPM
ncbi:unnamed protein product [Urochloa humidicola]